MPRRDGTGPMGAGIGTGRKMVGCFGDAPGMLEAVYGCGLRLHSRLRDGTCRYSPVTDRIALTAEKEFLENKLNAIDKKSNESSDKSTDRSNG